MRNHSGRAEVERVMDEFGKRIRDPQRIFFNGGASAVLLGLRESTVDIDLGFEHPSDECYRAIRELKELLNVNIEIALPSDFIPELPGWRERNEFIGAHGRVSFFHYDFYSQIMAKIERGWDLDLEDAKGFMRKLESAMLLKYFQQVEAQWVRYPAVDPEQLEKKLRLFIDEVAGD